MSSSKPVIIESPFGRNPDGSKCTPEQYARNTVYARRCLKDSLDRGESPFAGHLLYTQVLDDTVLEDRMRGMAAAAAWRSNADGCVVYVDYGVTTGMRSGFNAWAPHLVEYRTIGANPIMDTTPGAEAALHDAIDRFFVAAALVAP